MDTASTLHCLIMGKSAFRKHFIHGSSIIIIIMVVYRFFLGATMEMDNLEIIQQVIQVFQSK